VLTMRVHHPPWVTMLVHQTDVSGDKPLMADVCHTGAGFGTNTGNPFRCID
jgi:hypothetical protein